MKIQNEHSPLDRHWWSTSIRLWWYILKAHIGPFFLAFIVVMFVFLLQFLMRFIDKIVGKGLDLWTIVQLIVLNLAWMVVLALPMAALVASLMAFGSLAASNEMTAMKSAGVSFPRMLFPVFLAGLLLAYADLRFNNDILPNANHSAKDLANDIQRKKPTFSIKAGEFSNDNSLPGYSIFAAKTEEHSNLLEGVTIYNHANAAEVAMLTAEKGTISFTQDFKFLVMDLQNGEIHQSFNAQPDQYRRGHFTSYQVRIPTSGFDFLRQGESERGDRELSATELMKFVHNRDTTAQRQTVSYRKSLVTFADAITDSRKVIQLPDSLDKDSTRKALAKNELRQFLFSLPEGASQINNTARDGGSYLVEVHKKYALPVACFVFIILGAPLGALAKRGGIGIGVGFSIGFFILYWAFLIGGEKLADRGIISPWSGMWAANILLGIVGLLLSYRVMKEKPGFKLIPSFLRRNKS